MLYVVFQIDVNEEMEIWLIFLTFLSVKFYSSSDIFLNSGECLYSFESPSSVSERNSVPTKKKLLVLKKLYNLIQHNFWK